KIVSVPNMISKSDWKSLEEIGDVIYLEKENISEVELLKEIQNVEYLLLNYDVVKKLSGDFYQSIKKNNLPLKAISTDITGMSWANPKDAHKFGIKLLNTPN